MNARTKLEKLIKDTEQSIIALERLKDTLDYRSEDSEALELAADFIRVWTREIDAISDTPTNKERRRLNYLRTRCKTMLEVQAIFHNANDAND